jgi:hypothetical protein
MPKLIRVGRDAAHCKNSSERYQPAVSRSTYRVQSPGFDTHYNAPPAILQG